MGTHEISIVPAIRDEDCLACPLDGRRFCRCGARRLFFLFEAEREVRNDGLAYGVLLPQLLEERLDVGVVLDVVDGLLSK